MSVLNVRDHCVDDGLRDRLVNARQSLLGIIRGRRLDKAIVKLLLGRGESTDAASCEDRLVRGLPILFGSVGELVYKAFAISLERLADLVEIFSFHSRLEVFVENLQSGLVCVFVLHFHLPFD